MSNVLCAFAVAALLGDVSAQPPGAAPPPQDLSPQKMSPIDLEGYWVSVVTEDWLYRMVTPRPGDFESVPLNEHGEAVAGEWDPDADRAAGRECLAYGPPGLIRLPGRLHIEWDDEETLRVDFDTGIQSRLLRFDAERPDDDVPHSMQGFSRAEWQKQAQARFLFGAPVSLDAVTPGGGGTLAVATSHMTAGYLRKNGVPYSADAELQEYWDRITLPNGEEWLIVTSIVTDPAYLRIPFIVSTNFKREADGAKWMPEACSIR